MGDYTEIVILCEDRQQEVFTRYFLEKFYRIHPRRIRSNLPPAGVGSGEQWVRQQYRIEVKTYRRYSSSKKIALVVMIDADNLTYEERHRQLSKMLTDANLDERQPHERIALFIPKRNIETWLYFLDRQQESIDESIVYRHLDKESDCKGSVYTLAANCLNRLPLATNAPSSLQQACAELARILRD